MPCPLSVVVVVHDMARELPRTLATLDPRRQAGIGADDYEVVVVDNGSAEPVDPALAAGFGGRLRIERIDPAPPSPARAANLGLELAEGELVGLLIDGARLASPGLLATARLAARVAPRAIITALAWHLGPGRHMDAAATGYDQSAEDELLASTPWQEDGYALLDVSTLAASSSRGLFGPMGESSSLFLAREVWRELGGLDERFVLPGGGLVNHDLYRRACALDGAQLVVLLGEGTFHQIHGGAATGRRLGWDDMHAEYQALRGEAYRPPDPPAVYLGTAPTPALAHIEASARLAIERRAKWSAPGSGEGTTGEGITGEPGEGITGTA